MQACLPRAQAREDFPQPHFPCMSKFSCLRIKAQSAMAARSSLVKLRSVPQMTSSKSAVYLSLLIFRYMAVFRSRLSCTSASTILEMATSRDGRFCTGRLVMVSKEDDIALSFNSLSCMMVSCKFMLLYICLNVHKCLRASHIVVLWHI